MGWEARSGAASPVIPGLDTEPEERIQRSLFGEILDWMLVPLLLLWPMSIAITYLVAKSIANHPFDRALEDRVTVLAQQVKEQDGKLLMQLPTGARDILRADAVDNTFYQLRDTTGDQLEGDRDIPLPPDEDRPPTWTVQLRNDSIRNADVRVAYMYVSPGKVNSDGHADTHAHCATGAGATGGNTR